MQRLLVHLLLVERPAHLVESQFEVRRTCAHADNGAVGVFGIEEFLPDEVILAAPEKDLVEIPGVGILGDEPVHDQHRLIRLADLVVGAGQLVQDLVIALVVRIRLEDFPVHRDRFARSRRHRDLLPIRHRGFQVRCAREQYFSFRRPLLECLVRLAGFHGRCRAAFGDDLLYGRATLGHGHFDHLAGADDAVGLFDLQIRQAPHGLGGPGALRGFLQVTPVTFGRSLEAVGDIHFIDVRRHVFELGQRAVLGRRRCARGETY